MTPGPGVMRWGVRACFVALVVAAILANFVVNPLIDLLNLMPYTR